MCSVYIIRMKARPLKVGARLVFTEALGWLRERMVSEKGTYLHLAAACSSSYGPASSSSLFYHTMLAMCLSLV